MVSLSESKFEMGWGRVAVPPAGSGAGADKPTAARAMMVKMVDFIVSVGWSELARLAGRSWSVSVVLSAITYRWSDGPVIYIG